ncbi:MAG: dienelactone hydrolase family protein [Rubrivivax sp.]|nr:dienelactone hydrolase family protein [Rubrivivax sp.]
MAGWDGRANTGRGVASHLVHRLDVCVGSHALAGELSLVPDACGLVVFAHGSGSSRRSPRNRAVSEVLLGYGLDTLLFDLLNASEGQQLSPDFGVERLGQRLLDALRWVRAQEPIARLSTGLFGASTGAAAALYAAATQPGWLGAVVSRGGRPDLALPWLARVRAPTLLIVGGEDAEVQRVNRTATRALRCEWRLEVVPGASHLFEEAGAIETVAHLAGTWFAERLRVPVR